jgi:renalase
MADVLVIGAGVAGCLGARALRAAGHTVTVLDKGFVPGGRLASKNVEGATFDTGAQFLTARSDDFRAEVDRWATAGMLRTWFHGSPDLHAPTDPDGHPRFRGAPTMRRLAEHLADGLDLRLGTIAGSLEAVDGRWHAQVSARVAGSPSRPVWPPRNLEAVGDSAAAASGTSGSSNGGDQNDDGNGGATIETLRADAVLMTAPIPQALDILATGGTSIPEPSDGLLRAAAYAPTIAVLAVPHGPTGLPERGAIRIPNGDIEWITDNQVTGASSQPAITIHTGARFSADHLDAADGDITSAVLATATDVLGCRATAVHVHRWRFAKPTADLGRDCIVEQIDGAPLAFAGDAFTGGRVEGAARSGVAGAEEIIAALRTTGS